MIFAVISNFIDRETCNNLTDLLSTCEWESVVRNDVDIFSIMTTDIDEIHAIGSKLWNALESQVSKVAKRQIVKETSEAALAYTRYSTGQGLMWHSDGGDGAQTNTSGRKIDVSAIVYLNDEYSGGELSMAKANSRVNNVFMVKPSTGDLVIIDGATWHEALPVASGTKYVMSARWQLDQG
jgi:predicted 2-oxoglutarate/Fe(II)-dependent dioxygenase YbiX